MSHTRINARKKKVRKSYIAAPTPEQIAEFAPHSGGYLANYEEVQSVASDIGVVSREDYPGLPPTARESLACPMTPQGMQTMLRTMQASIQAEGASYAVPCNGRGIIICAPNAKGTYIQGGADDGLKKTDELVLVFDDVILKPYSTEGEPPYVDPTRADLCPNIKHVCLSDYLEQ